MLEVEMKRLIISLVFLALIGSGLSLFAQAIPPEDSSEFFYVNMTVEKIYPTRLGYIVQYRIGVNQYGLIPLPVEWFSHAGAKAEVVTRPKGSDWPSLTVFYKNGELSHLRLYVHASRAHPTWGNVPLPLTTEVRDLFKDVTTVKIDYEHAF